MRTAAFPFRKIRLFGEMWHDLCRRVIARRIETKTGSAGGRGGVDFVKVGADERWRLHRIVRIRRHCAVAAGRGEGGERIFDSFRQQPQHRLLRMHDGEEFPQ